MPGVFRLFHFVHYFSLGLSFFLLFGLIEKGLPLLGHTLRWLGALL